MWEKEGTIHKLVVPLGRSEDELLLQVWPDPYEGGWCAQLVYYSDFEEVQTIINKHSGIADEQSAKDKAKRLLETWVASLQDATLRISSA